MVLCRFHPVMPFDFSFLPLAKNESNICTNETFMDELAAVDPSSGSMFDDVDFNNWNINEGCIVLYSFVNCYVSTISCSKCCFFFANTN